MEKELVVKVTENRTQLLRIKGDKIECFEIDEKWYPIKKIGEVKILLEVDIRDEVELDFNELMTT